MAGSVYISKNIDKHQLKFLKLLEEHEVLYFNIETIESILEYKFDNLNEVLENLVDKELIVRLERGKFAISNYSNLNVLATFISQNSTIAYWSALYYHGLTERFPNIIFVKTTQRKRETQLLGSTIKFVSVNPVKNTGVTRVDYGDDSFPVTNIEMTLVDCFDQPRYAGDFSDLIKAFATAKLLNGNLIQFTKAYDNIALTKRLGFLASLFHQKKLSSFINFARTQVNKRYNLIDAGGLEQGEFVNEWKIRLNVSRDDLLNMAESKY